MLDAGAEGDDEGWQRRRAWWDDESMDVSGGKDRLPIRKHQSTDKGRQREERGDTKHSPRRTGKKAEGT